MAKDETEGVAEGVAEGRAEDRTRNRAKNQELPVATMAWRRKEMVEKQLRARGIRDERLLQAFLEVPRERFVERSRHDFAYDDTPLPIEEGQTISQPYIVAVMLEAARLGPDARVLEVGAGSGYATALISRMAKDAYGIEWHRALAGLAARRMKDLGFANAHIREGDGTLGWPDAAPFDAIVVSAGGPEVPKTLLAQLALGGRLVVPVGKVPRSQELVLVVRTGEHAYDQSSLGPVHFVPLVGSEGWAIDGVEVKPRRAHGPLHLAEHEADRIAHAIAEGCEPFASVAHAPLEPLLERIGDARVVLLGECTHGTSEFYAMRARITEALIARKGFRIVALEADWPDAASLDRSVRGLPPLPLREEPFSRFPAWMWRNREVGAFTDWLRARNGAETDPSRKVSVHGLDLYSLNNSIGAVVDYLERLDRAAAEYAREMYACFTPWERDPSGYGRAATAGLLEGCEREAVQTLESLLADRLRYIREDPDGFLDAARNATVVREAERYYRAMYRGAKESWNLRDQHMFDTLLALLEHRGPESRAVVWAHNSHVGDARATEMGTHGEISIGQLVRERFGDAAYAIGFGTDRGVVAAASDWDGPVEFKELMPSHPDSYEQLCHASGVPRFMLPLRARDRLGVRTALLAPRLQRAIGVIYRPASEMVSHYFQATLPLQFDEWIWMDTTTAVNAASVAAETAVPDIYPFGL